MAGDSRTAVLQHEKGIIAMHAAAAVSTSHQQQIVGAYAQSTDLIVQAAEEIWRAIPAEQQQAWPQGLELPNPELCHSEPPAELLSGLRALQQQLSQLVSQQGEQGWPQLYSQVFDNVTARAVQADRFLGDCSAEAKSNAALAQLPQRILQRMCDLSQVGAELTQPAEAARGVRAQLLDLTRAQALPMDRESGGQVEWAKVQLQTRLITFLKEMLRALDAAEQQNAQYADTLELRRQSEAASAALKEPRWRLKLETERALQMTNDSLTALDAADLAATRKYDEDMARSESATSANLQRQQECWQQIDALQQELNRLAASRLREVEWQLDEHAREAKRREEHKWAHKVAGEHKRRLETTLRHCEGALRCCSVVDTLVSDGALAAQRRHDQLTQELAQTKVAVLAEKEQELARLQQWGGEHRVTVASTLHDVQATSPLPSVHRYAQIASGPGTPQAVPAWQALPPAPVPLHASVPVPLRGPPLVVSGSP